RTFGRHASRRLESGWPPARLCWSGRHGPDQGRDAGPSARGRTRTVTAGDVQAGVIPRSCFPSTPARFDPYFPKWSKNFQKNWRLVWTDRRGAQLRIWAWHPSAVIGLPGSDRLHVPWFGTHVASPRAKDRCPFIL